MALLDFTLLEFRTVHYVDNRATGLLKGRLHGNRECVGDLVDHNAELRTHARLQAGVARIQKNLDIEIPREGPSGGKIRCRNRANQVNAAGKLPVRNRIQLHVHGLASLQATALGFVDAGRGAYRREIGDLGHRRLATPVHPL